MSADQSTVVKGEDDVFSRTAINMGLAGLELVKKSARARAILRLKTSTLDEIGSNADLMLMKPPEELTAQVEAENEPLSVESLLAAVPANEDDYFTSQLVLSLVFALKIGLAVALKYNAECLRTACRINVPTATTSAADLVDALNPDTIITLASMMSGAFERGLFVVKFQLPEGWSCMRAVA